VTLTRIAESGRRGCFVVVRVHRLALLPLRALFRPCAPRLGSLLKTLQTPVCFALQLSQQEIPILQPVGVFVALVPVVRGG
jgi:hypothetical protein